MSTKLKLQNIPSLKDKRRTIIVGALLVALTISVCVVSWPLYKKFTTNTVVAYFPATVALYTGDRVVILGVKVGSIDEIEPAGDKMKVTFHYESKYKVPAEATASILNPNLVASRVIQLSPPYTGGAVLGENAMIPIERTQVPVEWDELRNQITDLVTRLGPTPEQPMGPVGHVIDSFANSLAGKGRNINATLTSLSEALTTLNEGRGDLFGVLKSLALFVNALYQSDQQFVALNADLAQFTDSFTQSDRDLAGAIDQLDGLLTSTRKFVGDNGAALTEDINNVADATNALLQPTPRNGLETGLHVLPTMGANFTNTYEPAHGTLTSLPVIPSFANPIQFLCSSIQSGSRLGYQDSAELCAQYLAPILDAVKFNYLPAGLNQFTTADTVPDQISYSEERLRPPPGFKDTTVPGIFSRDTLFSHGNHEPGWVVAPGMQGVDVQPFTQNMLTPQSLAELMGGPDTVAGTPVADTGGHRIDPAANEYLPAEAPPTAPSDPSSTGAGQ